MFSWWGGTAGLVDVTGPQVRRLGEGEDGVIRGRNIRFQYRPFHDFFDQLEQIEKPIVLAAQGRCMGLGVEMAASCDFRLASC